MDQRRDAGAGAASDGSEKGTPSWIGVALLGIVLGFDLLKFIGRIDPWKMTHWLFSYDLGFVKRALVGTLMRALLPGGVVTRGAVVGVSLGFAVLLVAALFALALPLFNEVRRRRSMLVGVVALLAPGIGYLLSDLGRFDVPNLAICVLAIIAARRLGRFPYPLFLAIACLTLLVHEGALLLAVPMLFVGYLHGNSRLGELLEPRRWARLVLQVAPVLALFAALALFGRSDLELPELLRRLGTNAEFAPNPASAGVVMRSFESIVQVVDRATDEGRKEMMRRHQHFTTVLDQRPFWLLFGFASLQQLFAHFALRDGDRESRRPRLVALHLTFAAPLLLLAVGLDWDRWAGLASAQSAVLLMLFARDLPAANESLLSRRFLALTLGLVVVLAGSGYWMTGARNYFVGSPQSNLLSWWKDSRNDTAWYQAFLAPR